MSEYKMVAINPSDCRTAWAKAKPILEPAINMSDGRWTSDYVLAALVLGEQNLWVVFDETEEVIGAAVTELVFYPAKKAMAIHYLGGDKFDGWWRILHDTLYNFAELNSCDLIECNARFGFWKWFKHDGFSKASCFYEKPVEVRN